MEIQLDNNTRAAIVTEIAAALKSFIEELYQIQPPAPSPTNKPRKELPTNIDGAYTISGVCAYLNVTERWVRKQITERKINYFRVGRQIRFKKSELDKYIAAREVLPPQPFVIPVYQGRR